MGSAGSAAPDYSTRLEQAFAQFPDTHAQLRSQGLAFYRYSVPAGAPAPAQLPQSTADWEALIAQGLVQAEPITYEDFASQRRRHLPIQPGRRRAKALPSQCRAASI